MHDLVSIIVPVYNVAQYLDRCLNSLIGQTYPHIEILLIDDGSTDGSGALCDRWQERDGRIRVFHKANGGLSDARNHGLAHASGDYICFIDSDDWCDPGFVEVLLCALKETDSDVAECDHLCTDGSEPGDNRQPPYERSVYDGDECFLRFLTTEFLVIVCNKLYRRSILTDRMFRVGVYHEDEFWTYKIFSSIRRACRVRYTGYYYYQRHDSIVHTKPSRKRLTDAFDAAKERMDFIERRYPQFAAVGYAKMMYTCMFLYNEARGSDFPQKPGFQAELLAYFRILFKKYLRAGQYRKEMWRFCLFRLCPNRYCKLSH